MATISIYFDYLNYLKKLHKNKVSSNYLNESMYEQWNGKFFLYTVSLHSGRNNKMHFASPSISHKMTNARRKHSSFRQYRETLVL